MSSHWIADRATAFDSSGIRKVFELAARLPDPINLSIGQPHFDVPEVIQQAAVDAIHSRRNGYAPSQGIAPLLDKLQQRIDAEYQHDDRRAFITPGTSAALVLAMFSLVNAGDEVIIFDPYFAVYEPLIKMVGGQAVLIDTYPDFRIDVDRVRAAVSPRTKMIVLNSPCNPTGAVATAEEVRSLAELSAQRNIVLLSDEIYRPFCYDAPFTSPALFNPATLVIDGFSKAYAMTGWRLGYAHGPRAIIETMIKLQQYTFVCAPQPVQWAGITALDVDVRGHFAEYKRKRDMIVAGLKDDYELVTPAGAFYAFPKVPSGTDDEFIARAVEHQLLIIPGHVFSRRPTHFRISYAVEDKVLERGIDVLKKLARRPI